VNPWAAGTVVPAAFFFFMGYRQTLGKAALIIAVTVFAGSVLGAVVHSLAVRKRLPGISLEYLAEADGDLLAGNLERAELRYRTAVAVAPDDSRALYRLGVARQGLGDLPEAADAYRAALKLDPFDKLSHFNLAIVLSEQGKLADAVYHNALAVRLDPRFVEARTNLGTALASLGRIDEARAQYEGALAVNPSYLLARRALEALPRAQSAGRSQR
jgi:Flp pilus assembly protein TadD